MDLLYIINILFIFVGWKWAIDSFNEGNNFSGWLNIFGSALNAAVLADHFL